MQRSTPKGFTLVELLVVIGIIGVLVAILLPALNRAREQANSVQCMSNLRSCGQLLYLYANQNRGVLPMMKLDEPQQFPRNKSNVNTTLGGVTFKYIDAKAAMARIANPNQDPYATPFYAGALKVFYCPSLWFFDAEQNNRSHDPDDFMKDRATDPVTGCLGYWYFGNPDPWFPKYHYSGPFGGTLPGAPPAGAPGPYLDWRFWDTNGNGDNRDEYVAKLSEKGAYRKALMTDQSRQNGAGGLGGQVGFQFTHGPRTNPLRGWTNVLLADGHVESRKANASSFNSDRTKFINPHPFPDEVQPRWGNANSYQMW
jgi:prepilin-type N-terminal cleavage/methylation domain-containing protein/prepilin-type processing-associated H-X9-DG protein